MAMGRAAMAAMDAAPGRCCAASSTARSIAHEKARRELRFLLTRRMRVKIA
jgi:hypothetical protein